LSIYSLNKIYGRPMDRSTLHIWMYCRSLWLSRYVPTNFNNISRVDFSKICEMICELHFDGSLLHQISVQYVERNVGYMEQTIYSLSQKWTNLWYPVARTPKCFLKGHQALNMALVYVILLAPRIFK